MKTRRSQTDPFIEMKFTKDGYLDDGFVVNDDPKEINGDNHSEYFDLDSEPIQSDIINQLIQSGIDKSLAKNSVKRAFKETGEKLVQDYTSCKPSDESWKLGLDPSEVNKLEPELKRIRQQIQDEQPTIPKILGSNLTFEDKKKCIVLFDQLNNMEPYTSEHAQKIEEINNILRKSKKYSKEQIKQLEETEKKLKENALPSNDLKDRILLSDAPENVKTILYGQYLQMLEHEEGSQSYNSIKEEIEWSLKLPYSPKKDCKLSKKELNKYYTQFMNNVNKKLYGMNNVKLQMLHIINSKINGNKGQGRNIAIVGPPGVGKTSIAKALAEGLNLPCEKISVGGLEDASILKGTDKVWNSSSPSIVLQILSRLKSPKSAIIFDEVDKLGLTPKGKEVQYALLHISDYAHNHEFRDSYLNKFPHDLSEIIFIYIMNKLDGVDSALLDRMDIIHVTPYSSEDKKEIIKNYLLPGSLKEINFDQRDITLTEEAITKLVKANKDDPGIRTIEKVIKSLVDKVNTYNSLLGDDGKLSIDLPYRIPNFALPLKVDSKLLIELTKDKIKY